MMYEDNYLAHYGIKGQRWGIRRFQNEDGSLTYAGRARVAKTAGGGYLNPSTEDVRRGKAKARKKVADAYVKEWNRHFSADKHPSGPDNKERRIWNKYKKKYASATLKDLKLKDTRAARKSIMKILKQIDPTYDYDWD
jgi:transketolase